MAGCLYTCFALLALPGATVGFLAAAVQDVRRMGLTKKSEEKVAEIVATGHCRRADEAAGNETVQVRDATMHASV